MSTSGGTDATTAVDKMMAKLMTDDVRSKFSLKGARGKLAFVTLVNIHDVLNGNFLLIVYYFSCKYMSIHLIFILYVVVGAVENRVGPISSDRINEAITDSLKKANDRVGKRIKYVYSSLFMYF
jgi:hypothetical protein